MCSPCWWKAIVVSAGVSHRTTTVVCRHGLFTLCNNVVNVLHTQGEGAAEWGDVDDEDYFFALVRPWAGELIRVWA